MTLEDGAMVRAVCDDINYSDLEQMEPLAVAVHSVATLGGFRANQAITIFGCGPIGLLCMAVAKALGAGRVIAVDIVTSRLEFAKSYAATDTFKPPPPEDGESKLEFSRRSADQMKEQLGIQDRGSNAIDLVVDASGAEVSVQTALAIVKFGGTHVQVTDYVPAREIIPMRNVQVGMGSPEVTINMAAVLPKELVIKGSFRYGVSSFVGGFSLFIYLHSRETIRLLSH